MKKTIKFIRNHKIYLYFIIFLSLGVIFLNLRLPSALAWVKTSLNAKSLHLVYKKKKTLNIQAIPMLNYIHSEVSEEEKDEININTLEEVFDENEQVSIESNCDTNDDSYKYKTTFVLEDIKKLYISKPFSEILISKLGERDYEYIENNLNFYEEEAEFDDRISMYKLKFKFSSDFIDNNDKFNLRFKASNPYANIINLDKTELSCFQSLFYTDESGNPNQVPKKQLLNGDLYFYFPNEIDFGSEIYFEYYMFFPYDFEYKFENPEEIFNLIKLDSKIVDDVRWDEDRFIDNILYNDKKFEFLELENLDLVTLEELPDEIILKDESFTEEELEFIDEQTKIAEEEIAKNEEKTELIENKIEEQVINTEEKTESIENKTEEQVINTDVKSESIDLADNKVLDEKISEDSKVEDVNTNEEIQEINTDLDETDQKVEENKEENTQTINSEVISHNDSENKTSENL